MARNLAKPVDGTNVEGLRLLTGFFGINTTGGVTALTDGYTECNCATLTRTNTGLYTLSLTQQYDMIMHANVELAYSTAGAARDIEAKVLDIPGRNGVAAGKDIKLVTRKTSDGAAVDNANEAKTLSFFVAARNSGIKR